jgi:hypothetical protein
MRVLVQFRERPHFLRGWRRRGSAALASPSGSDATRRLSLSIGVTAAVFMALVGPFGTGLEPLAERLGFWMIGVTACVLFALALNLRLRRIAWLRPRPIVGSLATLTLIAPLAALPASAAAALIQGVPVNWPTYWQTVPQIFLVGVGLVGVFVLAARRAKPDAMEAKDPTLGGLLPLKFSGADVFAIEAQDHYVRVHSDRGTALVLMSFDAALGKAAPLSGLRVHRSWWVARAGVIAVRRGDGRAMLSLRGGAQAPVSRRYAKALRSAGWY